MDEIYIVLFGSKHFKCDSLLEVVNLFCWETISSSSGFYFKVNGYVSAMSYSYEWTHEDAKKDFIRSKRLQKTLPNLEIYKSKLL